MSRLVTDSVEDFIAGRYRIVDETAPAELVTEEIVAKAVSVYAHESRFGGYIPADMLARVLRAVAPLIAARALARGATPSS